MLMGEEEEEEEDGRHTCCSTSLIFPSLLFMDIPLLLFVRRFPSLSVLGYLKGGVGEEM